MDRSFDVLFYPDVRPFMIGITLAWVGALISLPFVGAHLGWTYETDIAIGSVFASGFAGMALLLLFGDPWAKRFRTRVTLSDRILMVGTKTYRYEDLWVRVSNDPFGGTRLLTTHTADGEIPLVRVQGTFKGRLVEFYLGRPKVPTDEFDAIVSFLAERTEVRESYLFRYSVLLHPYA